MRASAAARRLLVPLARGRAGPARSSSFRQAVDYNSHLAFTRLIYGSGLRGFGGFGGAAWSHDYPAADKNISSILDYITNMRVRLDGTNVLDLDDPEIFENPILYVWEPGYWTIQPSEAENLREVPAQGRLRHLRRLRGRSLGQPGRADAARAARSRLRQDRRARIRSFTRSTTSTRLDVPHPSVNVHARLLRRCSRTTIRRGRMIALANHNSDIAEYWEWSAEGLYNPDPTSNAYRLGVNYYVYAMTH